MVYIGGSADTEGAREELLVKLASRFRVIVLESVKAAVAVAPNHCEEPAFSRWLAGVLEGLGILSARFVVAVEHATAIAAFARANPDLVSRIALLGTGQSQDDGGLSVPLLTVAPNGPDAIDLMMEFLSM